MSKKTAINLMLGFVAAVTLFHLSILLKITPYEITWGGRLKSDEEMYVFETISIGINLILGLALLLKGAYLKPIISLKIVRAILWIFLLLFALNTVGNIFAETTFEKSLSVLTLGFVALIWIILRAKN
ncbi:MAG: hypothetical protein ACJA08_000647 [Cyclobacteriaceae bacterium]|jgi:hypothetical protein